MVFFRRLVFCRSDAKKKLENKSKPLDKSRVKWIIERLEEKVVTGSLTFYPENSVPNEKNGRVFNIE